MLDVVERCVFELLPFAFVGRLLFCCVAGDVVIGCSFIVCVKVRCLCPLCIGIVSVGCVGGFDVVFVLVGVVKSIYGFDGEVVLVVPGGCASDPGCKEFSMLRAFRGGPAYILQVVVFPLFVGSVLFCFFGGV